MDVPQLQIAKLPDSRIGNVGKAQIIGKVASSIVVGCSRQRNDLSLAGQPCRCCGLQEPGGNLVLRDAGAIS